MPNDLINPYSLVVPQVDELIDETVELQDFWTEFPFPSFVEDIWDKIIDFCLALVQNNFPRNSK